MADKIKITFFSNFLSHHQTPFCEAMQKLIGEGFTFVATEKMEQERLQLGFKDLNDSASYVLNSYENDENFQKALQLGKESDVVIIGSAPDVFIEERLNEDKLTFRYYERFFKQGKWRILDPRVLIAYYKLHFRYRKKNLRMLCASAYTAPDCRFISSYPKKTYKWGYFPPVTRYEDVKKVIYEKTQNSILWAGRFIDWKHPEAPIEVAKRLKEQGYEFKMDLIGIGPMKEKIESLIEKYSLKGYVNLLGAMAPEKVREHMEKNQIFLFTSDQNEGWGAVLNESMNSGCAVVASGAIGSVPYLINDGENGLIYKSGNVDDLFNKTKFLLDNQETRSQIGYKAYETLATTWNAECATERLLQLIEDIKNGKDSRFIDGPCSKD